MGEFFAKHFVAAHQQVGDFVVQNIGGRLVKQGGNVASYFCTPERRVIHSVVGPVSAERLLEEAKWAIRAFEPVANRSLRDQVRYLSRAHLMSLQGTTKKSAAMRQPTWWRGVTGSREQKIHALLATKSMAPLDSVFEQIFDHILGQKVSRAGSHLALANRMLLDAQEKRQPLLFVFHREMDNSYAQDKWLRSQRSAGRKAGLINAMLEYHRVIVLPLKEMPALSQSLERPPYQSPDGKTPLFVIARSDGQQLAAVTGWNSHTPLLEALAHSAVDAMKRRPPPLTRIRKSIRVFSKIDKNLGNELLKLAETVRASEPRKKSVPLARLFK